MNAKRYRIPLVLVVTVLLATFRVSAEGLNHCGGIITDLPCENVHEGIISSVLDGDTLVFQGEGESRIKVRLSEIDAPEKNQPHGKAAKQVLFDLTHNKPVRVLMRTVGVHGRQIGSVHVDGLDVNTEMVRQGHAWVYREYAKDPELFRLEASARSAKIGLWSNEQAIPPWKWRKGERGVQPPVESERSTLNSQGKQGCCKVCKKGKPCGNSCIARDKTCRKVGGCAC